MGSGPIGHLTLRCRVVVKLTSQNTVDWPGVGLKKKRKFQPLIKRWTVSSKIEGRGESEITSGRGMRKDTQMRQSLAALKMG